MWFFQTKGVVIQLFFNFQNLKSSNLVFTGDHHDEAYEAEDEGDDEGDDDDNDEGMFIVKE